MASSNNNKVIKDNYNLNAIGFCLLGMAIAGPGNFCLTAYDYWMYKFRDVNKNSSDLIEQTPYQVEFTTYFTIASTVPMFLVLFLNLYMLNRVNTIKRFLPGMTIMVFMFVLIVLSANVNTDTWQDNFFFISTFLIFLMGCGGQLIAGATFETLSYFPSKYMTAVNIGESVSNIFAALVQILSLYIGASSESSANIFFSVGTGISVMSFVIYISMIKSPFYKYYMDQKVLKNQLREELNSCLDVKKVVIRYWTIFKKISVQVGTAFVCLTLTFALYPGITILVNSQDNDGKWGKTYFKPTVHYLLTNIACIFAKILAGKIQKSYGRILLYISCLRILFVPFLLLCNIHPATGLGVWFTKDYQFALILILFMFSYGFIYNLSNIEILKVVQPHEASRALSFIGILVTVSSQCSSFLNVLILNWIKNGIL